MLQILDPLQDDVCSFYGVDERAEFWMETMEAEKSSILAVVSI